LRVPLEETAAKRRSLGDQATPSHEFAFAPVLAVQVIPSGEVIISDEFAFTAQNKAKAGDQVIPHQVPAEGDVLVVQVIPSSEVITAVDVVPLEDTETSLFRVGE
jgi:hypothetical protein